MLSPVAVAVLDADDDDGNVAVTETVEQELVEDTVEHNVAVAGSHAVTGTLVHEVEFRISHL